MNSDRVVILGLISKGIRRAAGPAGRKAVKLLLLFTIFTIVLMGFLYQVVFSIEADAAVGDSAVNAAKGKRTAASKVEGTAAKAVEGTPLPIENEADSTNPQKRKALEKYADSLGDLYGQSFCLTGQRGRIKADPNTALRFIYLMTRTGNEVFDIQKAA